MKIQKNLKDKNMNSKDKEKSNLNVNYFTKSEFKF